MQRALAQAWRDQWLRCLEENTSCYISLRPTGVAARDYVHDDALMSCTKPLSRQSIQALADGKRLDVNSEIVTWFMTLWKHEWATNGRVTPPKMSSTKAATLTRMDGRMYQKEWKESTSGTWPRMGD